MADEKTTTMVIKADLQCPCCYNKIKKILCKFPQIRSQVFDEKTNTIIITVVCYDPGQVREKLYCKGGKSIHSIDILDLPKKSKPTTPKEPEKSKEDPKQKDQEKPKQATPPPQPKKALEPPPPPPPEPVKIMPPDEMIPAHYFPQPIPTGYCCMPYYDGLHSGPCYHGVGYGRLNPPPPTYDYSYDGLHSGPCYHGVGYGRPNPPPPTYDYNYGKPCYVSRGDYFCEENPHGCSIM